MQQSISPIYILLIVGLYFFFLVIVSFLTSRQTSNRIFFTAGRQSPWFLVAFGMIGATLSGVTFISIPGVVGAGGANMNFSYLQMVLGFMVGYICIAFVLMPLYYKMGLTTIYQYLHTRLGIVSYKIGALCFLVSRVIGASFRLYLVAIVLQHFVMNALGVSFYVTVLVTIVLIWVYTFRGGIKTIVWTDFLQTTCMLAAVIMTIAAITSSLELESLPAVWNTMSEYGYTQIFYLDGGWSDPNNFFKQFIGGALICIVMTGLDQDMMQKNLTCRNLADAQKNMMTFSVILFLANILFLSLGALLYVFVVSKGIDVPDRTDLLFPTLALQYFSPVVAVVFTLGLIAAAYSSADSALTALTTSFCIDFLNFENSPKTEAEKKKTRMLVHVSFSVLLFVVIVVFKLLNNDAVINSLFKVATYTYGPLLGLFSFSLLTRRAVYDRWVWVVCLLAPIIAFMLDFYSVEIFNGFQFGFLSLALNGLLTFLGLYLLSYHKSE